MASTRRQFIKRTVSAAVGASAFNAVNAPFVRPAEKTSTTTKRPTLVVVYLRGGADPLNAIIPYMDGEYYRVRPEIAIPSPYARSIPEGLKPSVPLNKIFAMRPAMAPLAELFKQGMLAAIINTGSTHETRSHFDAQDFMEWAAPGIKSIQEGWLNRYLQMTAKPDDHFLRAFSPQPLLPRSLRGKYSVLAAPGPGSSAALSAFADLYAPREEDTELIRKRQEEEERLKKMSPAKRRAIERARKRAEEKYGKPPVTGKDLYLKINNAGVNTEEKLSHLNKILDRGSAHANGYPRGQLGEQLSDIATVIKAGEPIEISAVDYNGWDHHSYQPGQMARMLEHLSGCIEAFVKDVGAERMKNVMLLTMTEFGRTVRENGSQGSDHGHGGFMLAIGGRVNGGKIYGRWTGLQTRQLYRKRDLPVYTDFRDVFAETLAGLFQFDIKENDFFPGYKNPLKRPLGLIRHVRAS